MTRQQTTVIWLGLILVTLNLIMNIGEIKSVIFGGQAPPTGPNISVPPGQTAPGVPSFNSQSATSPTTTPVNVQVA